MNRSGGVVRIIILIKKITNIPPRSTPRKYDTKSQARCGILVDPPKFFMTIDTGKVRHFVLEDPTPTL